MSELPMTEPNSLFSNMTMTIWSKFGTAACGCSVAVADAVGLGRGVVVGTGVMVGTSVTVGRGGNLVGVGVGAPIQPTSRVIKIRLNGRNSVFMDGPQC